MWSIYNNKIISSKVAWAHRKIKCTTDQVICTHNTYWPTKWKFRTTTRVKCGVHMLPGTMCFCSTSVFPGHVVPEHMLLTSLLLRCVFLCIPTSTLKCIQGLSLPLDRVLYMYVLLGSMDMFLACKCCLYLPSWDVYFPTYMLGCVLGFSPPLEKPVISLKYVFLSLLLSLTLLRISKFTDISSWNSF